jgi:hypothetical protein
MIESIHSGDKTKCNRIEIFTCSSTLQSLPENGNRSAPILFTSGDLGHFESRLWGLEPPVLLIQPEAGREGSSAQALLNEMHRAP